jgi:hypothetical protein
MPSTSIYYMRPDEVATYSATVTTSAGTTDTDYTDDWICDTRPGRPARATNGTVTWSASFSSAEVGLIAACSCNSDVNMTLGGGVSSTITAGALQADGIRLNGFATQTPANETNITIAFSGAGSAVVLGELVAGKYRTLTRPVYTDDETSFISLARTQDMDLSSIPPYDPGLSPPRTWSGAYIVNTADRDNIVQWYLGQRNNTRPSLLVPDTTVNDAWLGFLARPSFSPAGGIYWSVKLTFTEVPRVRW